MLFPNAEVVVNPFLLVLLGLIVGTLTGFFAAGGFLITSGLLVFGVPPLFAVGTGLAIIMGSQLINTLKQRQRGNVDFKLAGLMLSGTVPGLFLAERMNSTLEALGLAGPVIGYIYTALLSSIGAFTLYDYRRGSRRRSDTRRVEDELVTAQFARRLQAWSFPAPSVKIPGVGIVPLRVPLPVSRIESISFAVPIGIGLGVSFIAGILGAGSGFILLPLLIFVLGVPTTVAVGTGVFQIFITGSLGTLFYALSNNVDLLMVIIMLAASSAGAPLGAAANRLIDPARIRHLYAITLLGSAVAIALRQVSEIASTVEFLPTVASILLLTVSGTVCIVIVVLLVQARREKLAASRRTK